MNKINWLWQKDYTIICFAKHGNYQEWLK